MVLANSLHIKSESQIQFWACFSEVPEERIELIKKMKINEENLKVIRAISTGDPNKVVQSIASEIIQSNALN